MKKKLSRIFACILCLMIGFIFVGCSGNDSDYADNLKEAYENGQISYEEYLEQRQSSMSVPLYGTKVLYRPTNYNWDDNVGGEANSNYYEQYSWWLLNGLIGIYGLTDNENELYTQSLSTDKPIYIPPSDSDKVNFYDSIRYQILEYSNSTIQKIVLTPTGTDANGDTIYTESNPDIEQNAKKSFYEISANLTKNWNWYFGENISVEITDNNNDKQSINSSAYLFDQHFEPFTGTQPLIFYNSVPFDTPDGKKYFPSKEPLQTSSKISNYELFGENSLSANYLANINTYYNNEHFKNAYANLYLGTKYTAYGNDFSDYVKALEYAIYCINLDLRPNNITVEFDKDGMPIVEINGYLPSGTPGTAGYKSSVEVALESIKEIFKQIGTYVGVTERQQVRLKKWILENIIGNDSDSTFEIAQTEKTYTQYVKLVDGKEVFCDKDGNPQTEFNPHIETTKTEKLEINRNYEENVEAIIEICTKQVSIGTSTEGSGPNIDDKFVASEICDYYGNDFFISADKGNEFKNIPVMEYQSMCFMFGKDYEFSNMMLFFRYGYDNEGNQAVADDESITINVYLHKYTKATNTWKVIPNPEGNEDNPQFSIEVKAGPFDYGSKNNTMMMFGLKERDAQGNQTGVKCGEWERSIADGALNSITDGYIGLQSIGTRLPINGNDKRKDYYQLVDRAVESDPVTGDTTKYVSYGILNPAAFDLDPNGCDYIELAFEIVKDTYDQNSGTKPKNYSFQVGIGMIDGPASTRK